MKSYVLVSGDFTPWGGMDRANYELAWHLAERLGAQVHLVSHHVHLPLATHANITWHRVAKPLNSYQLAGSLLARRGCQVAQTLKEQGSRVVVNGGNCPWPDVNWVHAVHAAWDNRDAGAPLWFRLKNRWAKASARRAEAKILRNARVVLANSKQTRQQIIEHLDIPDERVHVVYLGVDPSAYRPISENERMMIRQELGFEQDRLLAIFVGALGYDRNKGFDVIFAAWKALCQGGADILVCRKLGQTRVSAPRSGWPHSWDVGLIVVGGGAELAAWQQRIQEAGLQDRIRFLGYRKDVPRLLAACDVMIHPAHYEAYGLSVQEALCRGLPALVSAQAGIAERYPPELHDLLIDDPEDPAALVEHLIKWRENVDKYQAAVIPFSNSLRSYTWEHMAERIVHLVQAAA